MIQPAMRPRIPGLVELTVHSRDDAHADCDGAVGLCGVIAARRLGAEQIIMLGRRADRIALARKLGATDVVSERGDAAIERVRELTGGLGAHSVLECVRLRCARP